MLAHMLYVRAAGRYDRPNMDAHARLSCKIDSLGKQISSGVGGLVARINGIFNR
ncbi:MAG: hypothetical protein AAF423_07680 [Pseudomonadota bacterium]